MLENGVDVSGKMAELTRKYRKSSSTECVPNLQKVTILHSSWLIYDRFKLLQKYASVGISVTASSKVWGGKGELGLTVDTDISPQHIERMDW